MATKMTAKEFGEQTGLTHLEVIRRIRRGDIVAEKLGWFWLIDAKEVDRVRETDWHKRLMAKRSRAAHVPA